MSNTLALFRPTPRTPCSCPDAPRDSRIQNQTTSRIGTSRISQPSTSEPKPGDDVEYETVVFAACRSFSVDWGTGDGRFTVKLVPLLSVPVAVPPSCGM